MTLSLQLEFPAENIAENAANLVRRLHRDSRNSSPRFYYDLYGRQQTEAFVQIFKIHFLAPRHSARRHSKEQLKTFTLESQLNNTRCGVSYFSIVTLIVIMQSVVAPSI